MFISRAYSRVVRLADGEAGLSSRTIKRRLSSVSGLYVYLVMCEEQQRLTDESHSAPG